MKNIGKTPMERETVMKRFEIRLALAVVLSAAVLMGCASGGYVSQTQQDAGVAGTFIGAAVGALINDSNPYQGAVIGAGVGAAGGFLMGTVMDQHTRRVYDSASKKAAWEDATVTVQSKNPGTRIVAEPQTKGSDSKGNFTEVTTYYYQDDQLARKETRRIYTD
jgi:hypothetical protein